METTRDVGQGVRSEARSPGQSNSRAMHSAESRSANGVAPITTTELATTSVTGGDASPLSIADRALAAAERVAQIGGAARMAFIDRDTAISVLEWAMVCGEHACILGSPGTGKSALVRFFADGMGMAFFRLLLNPDTTRDEAVGPIDPFAFAQGVWDRCWMGLATCPIVFFDEVGKASSQVLNMFLDAMEERLVTSAGKDKIVPLHTLVGASNETLGDDLAAAWDRFALRLVVRRLDSASKVHALLTRKRGKRQTAEDISAQLRTAMTAQASLSIEDLQAMRAQALFMAENPSDEVAEMVVKLWANIENVTTEPVSERRWERLVIVAAGRALLHGSLVVRVEDLIVAQHMLWGVHGDIELVQSFVRNTVDEESAEIAAKTRLVEELEALSRTSIAGIKAGDPAWLEAKARISYRADKIAQSIRGRKKTRAEWQELRTRLDTLKTWALED